MQIWMCFSSMNILRILLLASIWTLAPCPNVCPSKNGGYTVRIHTEKADIPLTEPNVTLSCLVSGNVNSVATVRWFFKGHLQVKCPPYNATSNEPDTTSFKACNVNVSPTERNGYTCKVYDHLGRRKNVKLTDQKVCDGLRLFSQSIALQPGLWQRVPCLAFSRGDASVNVAWYKVSSETNKTRLISTADNYSNSTRDRYGFSSDLSLLIKGVERGDEGTYLCKVLPHLLRNGTIKVEVIGDSFPLRGSVVSKSIEVNATRGLRKTIRPSWRMLRNLDELTSAVFWSSGEGTNTGTDIIGARFADGTVQQNQHGANYAIGRDYSLTINSWSGVRDRQRFWCHVFRDDGNLENYYTDVNLYDTNPYEKALRASESSVYVIKGTNVVVPCPQWKSGDKASFIQWLKIDKRRPHHQLLLKYNVHQDHVHNISTWYPVSLAANFSLIIEVADEHHAGRYMCSIRGPETNAKRGEIYLHVIGESFPVTTANASSSVDLKRGVWITLPCPCMRDSHHSAISAVFWSTGDDMSMETKMIGFRLANGTSRLLHGSSNYRLIDDTFSLGMRLQDDADQQPTERLWCHVFRTDDTLQSCYTDAELDRNPEIPKSCSVSHTAYPAVCTIMVPIVLLMLGQVTYTNG